MILVTRDQSPLYRGYRSKVSHFCTQGIDLSERTMVTSLHRIMILVTRDQSPLYRGYRSKDKDFSHLCTQDIDSNVKTSVTSVQMIVNLSEKS